MGEVSFLIAQLF